MKTKTNNPIDPVFRPLAVTVKKAAELMSCSEKTVRRLVAQKQLKACQKLRTILIPITSIEKFLE